MDRYGIVSLEFDVCVQGVRVQAGYTQNYFDMAVHTADYSHSYRELVYGVTLCRPWLLDVQMLHDYLGYPLNSKTCSQPVKEGLYLVFYDTNMDRYELLRVMGPEGIVEPTLIKSAARLRRY